ncbi:MAG TPA: arginine N-succinyltransferase [Haliangiales bacterium]|nr:arginine N-succinyltransferase [Haliangiales bacterium]
MFSIREAFPSDLDELAEVAVYLDTVNLPNDRAILERIIDVSRRSFDGQLPPFEREYLFVLVDHDARRLVGTCMIQAQHGTRRSPHVFYEVLEDERYSDTLDLHFVHRCLRIGWSYAGPTEIGGLILLPEYRGRPQGLGKLLSYVRFLYIGLHRERFRDEVLSELLPPLEPDGTSLLWESLGRKFTGLSYQEADRLSKDNKEFIRALFPQDMLYTTLLPQPVQGIIGQVGPNTRGVEKMLRAIGFTHAGRIDPFDGGPHFTARTGDVTLVRDARRARVAAEGGEGTQPGIVAVERAGVPHFVATGARFRLLPDGEIALPEAVRRLLDVAPGEEVGCVPV